MFFLLIGILAISCPIIVYSANAANSNVSRVVYACLPQGQVARCHPSLNKFDSLATTGQIQRVFTVNQTKIDSKGGFYGFPGPSSSRSSSLNASSLQTDNASAISPARTYNPPIIPAQAIFYDHNKLPILKGRFLVMSYAERSIYAIKMEVFQKNLQFACQVHRAT